ncbi:MAG: aminoacyl-tRNA hydrolase [Marinilabiliales bacterium]|nr:MAG: aminoacyl-tRNA hydrolase [Marinilabiliales bacterium]
MKYLIAGLGNFGEKYANTRHNIGFMVLDTLAGVSNISFEDRRYGFVAGYRYRARTCVLLKPTTYMNLSGRAVNYWLQKEKIPVENMFVIVDDLALPFGTIRIRAKGGDGGHNGLYNINQVLGRQDYPRLRFGIGGEYGRGSQVDYVLGEMDDQEQEILPARVEKVIDAVHSFVTAGIERTMNLYNNR